MVDDEPEIVDLVSMVLEGEDRELLVAYDGSQALDIAREERPDLVLTDVMMPRLDGRELCMQIKADPVISETRIILMSAMRHLDPEGCKADALIQKPFDISEVADTVEQLLMEPS